MFTGRIVLEVQSETLDNYSRDNSLMHLVCEITTDFLKPNIHAPQLSYWLKDKSVDVILCSQTNVYSSGYTSFIADQLHQTQPLPLTALQRRWQGMPLHNLPWGSLQLVHWQVGREVIALHPELDLQITAEEHAAIESDITALLREDGFAMEAQRNGVWHIAAPQLAHLHCCDLARAARRDVREIQPQALHDDAGAKALKLWHRIGNELQMLLYSHPVNDQRAANLQLTLNAVWLSGCGALPSSASTSPAKPQWTHLPIHTIEQLEATLQSHNPETLTLCGADRYLTLSKQQGMKRWFAPKLTLEKLLAAWHADANAAMEKRS